MKILQIAALFSPEYTFIIEDEWKQGILLRREERKNIAVGEVQE